ncbi:hypothetical protein RFI_09432 [Reticulomyxa filosa]|uniref:Uncharacterized protein n=1 Tax=Reticulomyxa filosa TaxID=46433 RepID=X6NNV6_RETFI|nr:hypothetical protein RFI_09432 [Reticulomyxa filosa]|eukprot:ETO27701.1 hypothetical protein RFI_09432 [Reticulomyxa filosa]
MLTLILTDKKKKKEGNKNDTKCTFQSKTEKIFCELQLQVNKNMEKAIIFTGSKNTKLRSVYCLNESKKKFCGDGKGGICARNKHRERSRQSEQKVEKDDTTKKETRQVEALGIEKSQPNVFLFIENGVIEGVDGKWSTATTLSKIKEYSVYANEALRNEATCVVLWNIPCFVKHFGLIDLIYRSLSIGKNKNQTSEIPCNGVLQLGYFPSLCGKAWVRMFDKELANALVQGLNGYRFDDFVTEEKETQEREVHQQCQLIAALVLFKPIFTSSSCQRRGPYRPVDTGAVAVQSVTQKDWSTRISVQNETDAKTTETMDVDD